MNRVLVNKREVRESKLKHGDLFELGRTRFLVQALVQAEVQAATELEGPRANALKPILVVLAVAGATIGLYMWWIHGGHPPEESFDRAQVVESSVTTTGDASVTIEEIEAPASAENIAALAADITVADVTDVTESDLSVSLAENRPEPVSEEIRSMREEIASLRETMLTLASREPVDEPGVLEPPSIVDTLRQKTEEMMAQARATMDEGKWVDADQILANIQAVDPAFIDSFVARAELYERRGMIKRAMEQWGLVSERCSDVALADRALTERLRLQKLDLDAGAPRQVMISSVEQQKFPESEDYDEMRMLKVTLRQADSLVPIDPEALRVDVVFFEEDGEGGTVRVSRVETARSVVKIDTPWDGESREKTVTATYIVPKGFREGEAKAGTAGRYHGYVVGVYYHDALQDEDARPRTLLFRKAEDDLGTSIGGRTNGTKIDVPGRES